MSASSDVVLGISPLGFPWKTVDPFLFCVYHDDAYPAGDERMAPAVSLAGRDIGQDFEGKDGWRMYHGDVVPGFPNHPHRGFETVTIVRKGYVDHSDSLGATARYGAGDVQWLTAGRGIVHSEMFPLLNRAGPNPLELFQIWLNLPARNKLAEPHFAMFWRDDVPVLRSTDAAGRPIQVTVIAGRLAGLTKQLPPPPPKSWGADPSSDLAIWTIKLGKGATFTVPATATGAHRTLYLFRGAALRIAGHLIPARSGVELRADRDATIENGPQECELLLLQGRPIGEPVAQHGPFVMNSLAEVQQAFLDYRLTGFGGWSWPSPGPVHDRDAGRFALYPDGRREHAP